MTVTTIGLLLFHDYLELDVVGPLAVLRTARLLLLEDHAKAVALADLEEKPTPFQSPLDFFTIARSRMSVVAAGGLLVTPNYAFTATPPKLDVLIIPGGPGIERAGRDVAIRNFVQLQAGSGVKLAAVSSGALLLGMYGLLTGLRVTTWPPRLEQLWQYNPEEVVEIMLLENDNGWLFSGHSVAGLQLGLRLVERCCGQQLAQRVAVHMGIDTGGW
jgi:transcriptional regulator GlxA family with amidase domain